MEVQIVTEQRKSSHPVRIGRMKPRMGWRMIVFLAAILLITACTADKTNQPADREGESSGELTTPTVKPIDEGEAEEEDYASSSAEETPVMADPLATGPDESDGEAIEIVKKEALPERFVYLDEIIPSAQYKMGYYGEDNFVGTRIDGYLAPLAIATVEAAEALLAVSHELAESGCQLVIYDSYRPQKAVDHFIRWSQDQDDLLMEAIFYPNVDKDKLFSLGYLAKKSGHSRGSTIDLTLASLETGEEIDMGSPVDMLDEISHFASKQVTGEQAANRSLLKKVMSKHGFKPYSKEWWHYTLENEPYPDTYFDFDVE